MAEVKLTPAKLAEIEALLASATPGPWEAIVENDPRGQPSCMSRSLVCFVERNDDRALSVVADRATTRDEWEANTRLIALGRNTLPRLLAHIHALEADLERARLAVELAKAVQEYDRNCGGERAWTKMLTLSNHILRAHRESGEKGGG